MSDITKFSVAHQIVGAESGLRGLPREDSLGISEIGTFLSKMLVVFFCEITDSRLINILSSIIRCREF
jgi:hypothetical protein